MLKRTLVIVLVLGLSSFAFAENFGVPYPARVYIASGGGDFGAVTEFGLGTSESNHVAYLSGLPANPSPAGEVLLGTYEQDAVLKFSMKSLWAGHTDWAFSDDTVTAASRTAFMDLDNSLGLGGNVIPSLSSSTWRMCLDNANSFRVDDDDNDLYVNIRLEAVPEPTALATVMCLIAGCLLRVRA